MFGDTILCMQFKEALPDSVIEKAIPTKYVPDGETLWANYERWLDTIHTGLALTGKHRDQNFLPRKGEMFPQFYERDVDGRIWTERDIYDHVAVFNLWYSGCGPCRAEMPELSTWKERFPDVMFFSATWHDSATVRRITEQHHFTWTHLCNARQMMTWVGIGTMAKDSVIELGYPFTVVIDKEGIVRHMVNGTNAEKRQEILDCIQRYR